MKKYLDTLLKKNFKSFILISHQKIWGNATFVHLYFKKMPYYFINLRVRVIR